MEVRRQANEALQQAQAEITQAEQAAAEAHQQVPTDSLQPVLAVHYFLGGHFSWFVLGKVHVMRHV